eukprot:scaffold18569_cov71-Phaeocystis_antarctica.AAC.1
MADRHPGGRGVLIHGLHRRARAQLKSWGESGGHEREREVTIGETVDKHSLITGMRVKLQPFKNAHGDYTGGDQTAPDDVRLVRDAAGTYADPISKRHWSS